MHSVGRWRLAPVLLLLLVAAPWPCPARVSVHRPNPRDPAVVEAIEHQLEQAPSLQHALEDVDEALTRVYSSVPARDSTSDSDGSPRFRSTSSSSSPQRDDRLSIMDDSMLNLDPPGRNPHADEIDPQSMESFTAPSDDMLTSADMPTLLSIDETASRPSSKADTAEAKEERAEVEKEQALEKASKKLDSPATAQDPDDSGSTGSDAQLRSLLTTLDEHDDAEDALVGTLVKNMVDDSKHKKLKGTKATVVTNSNVLNHKSKGDPDKNVNIEDRMKKTQEEGMKTIKENEQKDLDEKSQKDKERKSKQAVSKQRESLRKEYHKEADEQNKKEVQEHREKRRERDEKTLEESSNKKKVQEVRNKATEQMDKGRIEMNQKRIHEDKEKQHMEKDNKHKLEEARKQGERDRKAVEQKLEQQRQQEEAQKREKLDKEQQKKQEWQRQEHEKKTEIKNKEEAKKQEKMQETVKWCDCYTQHTHWEIQDGAGKWGMCRDGWLVTGFNRGKEHLLTNLFYFRCCRPCSQEGSAMATTDCQTANWWSSFDRAGWSMCPDNYYIMGLYKNYCPHLYCLEEARCCRIAGSRSSRECNAKGSWATSFDNEGWSNLDENLFMRGLYRSDGQMLFNLEYPFQCSAYSH